MPFGLINISILYQSFINNIFRKYLDDFVIVYLDDIVIYLKTKEEHIKHVTTVLETLEKADIRINSAKNVFHV
jgi:hypothetical protein